MPVIYPHLSSPITVRGKIFKNRMITAPLGYGPVDNLENYIHAENIQYYAALARGGSARVITGDHPVTNIAYVPEGMRFPGGGPGGPGMRPEPGEDGFVRKGNIRLDFYSPRSYDMRFEHSIADFIRVVHEHDALAFTEFDYAIGRDVSQLSRKHIEMLYNDFATCFRRAMELGLDGAMLHGGHQHIQDQFRSRMSNHRTDEYGGSLENRCRFSIECLEHVREAVGDKFLIELRLSSEEGPEDGITIEETVEFCKMLEGRGLVDILHISTGTHSDARFNAITSSCAYMRPFWNIENCKKIKAAGVTIPLAICNGVNDPDTAEMVIREGIADFVTAARQFNISDPYFPRKVLEGRPELINNCLRCYSCYNGYECGVNPIHPSRYYDELTYLPPKAQNPRRVVVVGGGIAGMKAAETAAAVGHKVTLLEKENYLGGLLRFTNTDAYKRDLERFKNKMIKRVESTCEVRLGVEATPELVAGLEPEALIVAVGSEPAVPAIPGIKNDNVLSMMDVYDHPESAGDAVAVIGGGLSACEVAMHLGKTGHKVTIIGRRERLAYYEKPHVDVFDCVPGILEEYKTFDRPVEVIVSCEAKEITDGGAKCRKTDTGEELTIKADTIVYAAGMNPRSELAYSFSGIAPYFRVCGDARKEGKVKHCITTGYRAAMDIDK